MKFDKDVVRKVAAAALILSLVLFATVGAAEDGAPKKGFVLFGLSQLYDGTDQIGGGVGELLEGNRLLVDGLDTLGAALDDDIAGNLQTMKSGIDGQILPGLGSILGGITGKVVPGLGDIRGGLKDKMSPGLGEMITGFEGQIIPGLQQIDAGIDKEMITGLDKLLGGITHPSEGMIFGLSEVKKGVDYSLVPNLDKMSAKVGEAVDGIDLMIGGITADPLGLLAGLDGLYYGINAGILPFLGEATTPVTPSESTSIRNDLAILRNMVSSIGGADTIIGGIEDKVAGLKDSINGTVLGTIVMIKAGVSNPSLDPKPGLLEGLGGLRYEITKSSSDPLNNPDDVGLQQALGLVRYGLSGTGSAASPGVSEVLASVLAGLGDSTTKDTVVYGLTQIRGGLAGPVGGGLEEILAALRGKILPGLKEMKAGMDDQMIPGLGDMITGFNRTEAATGESGVVEGLTKISHGLANPAFTPNPGGDPGVSDGLGLVIGGIRTDVLGGIGDLKGGITEKIMPGLEQMSSGITDELQPGFTKVSLLLLAIWAVSLIILLVVGILIGRSGKAKASAGRSASA